MNFMDLKNLKELADSIPDLGCGGRTVKNELTLAAFGVRDRRSIIDIAPYLGSTTAYIGLGVNMSGKKVHVHSYDLWEPSPDYIDKSKKYHNIELNPEEDLKRRWREYASPFENGGCKIFGHKESIFEARYEDNWKIGLYVDDICNNKRKNDYAFKLFSPFFVPGETILFLMDWGFHVRDYKPLKYQKAFTDANSHALYYIGTPPRTYARIFLYTGGEFNYINGDYDE